MGFKATAIAESMPQNLLFLIISEVGFDSSEVDLRPDFVLFNETPGTFLVEVENEKIAKQLFTKVSYSIIGKTISDNSIRVNLGSKKLCLAPVDSLKQSWQKPMKEIFHS